MHKLYVVGAGTGNYEDFTIKAINCLNFSDAIYCDEKMYEKIKHNFDISKLLSNEYTKTKTRCNNAINSANNGITTSIIGSGDTGIYGISSIIYDEIERQNFNVEVEVISGMTSAIAGASLLGSPLTQDFVIISLSDNLSDKEKLKEKLESVAKTNFVIVFYSPCNNTKENLMMAREILLKYRSPQTVIGIANYLGENIQSEFTSTIDLLPLQEINAFSTIFVGNNETYVTKSKRIVTPLYIKK